MTLIMTQYFESDDSDKEDSSSDNDSGYADPSSDSDKKRSRSTLGQRRRVKMREDADEMISSDTFDQLVYTSPETQRHYTREPESAGSRIATDTNTQGTYIAAVFNQELIIPWQAHSSQESPLNRRGRQQRMTADCLQPVIYRMRKFHRQHLSSQPK